ncbi:restriction endonuclease subunit S [Leuconostoc citreum]|uniref:restriction endonuclease subunit S n=1 Tax=Leuconostoc citreum TaxID=33964 RepID=UPI001FB88A30|nr:restriction endonuclease subunit S [Leuconostoc citreum]MCJ2167769.1 restriction endonuclease subunit S [Leuconostoc citreum]
MQTKKRKSPSLRFRGYTDDWEERKLGDSVALFGGNSFKSQDAVNDGVKWLKIANVGIGLLKWGEQSYLPEFFLEKYPSYVLNIGDYVMALTRPILNHELKIAQVNESNILLNQRVAKLDFKVNKSFGYQLLRKRDVIDFLESELAGTDPPNLSSKTLDNILVNLPSTDEQQKIGTFFKQLDNTIALHQRKLDLLKEQKKGFLQKMFPKNGAKIPELRFEGFSDDWELRKLKDVTERVRSNDGRMDLPTLTMSASSGWLDQKDRFSGDISGKEKKNYTLLKKGELSYNHGNSKLAKYGVVFSLTNYEEALVPRVYHSFKALENTSADFIEYMFSTKLPDRELGKLVSSGARMDGLLNINYDDFMNIHISIPNYEEQILMSAFFRKLDETIALHQRKLDLLKEQKKGFLQKMFV